jgi:Dolichyl-phosphate-mannose-protein mannosyltransferase
MELTLTRPALRKIFQSPLWPSLLFILLGAVFIPYAGFDDDELLFVNRLIPHWRPSGMLTAYIGNLQAPLYWPILKVFGASVWSVRLPRVMVAALTIWIFYYLTVRAAGRFGGWLAAALLATDSAFLLSTTFDRGGVALQQFFLVAGCYCLMHSAERADAGTTLEIALGFFCFGLAMWNKAIFGWALAGLVAGGVIVFWPEIRRALTRRNFVVAAAAFLLGCLPLVSYNLRYFNSTLSEYGHLERWDTFRTKWIALRNVANGSLFAEDFVRPEDSADPKPAASWPGRASVWIREHSGPHHATGFAYVFVVLLAAVPWWWRSRAARFSLVFAAVTWLMMAATRRGAPYSGHIILLWPFPILFVVSTLAQLRWRRTVVVALAAMIAMNLLVLSQFVSQYERNGPDEEFTDAIFPLSAALTEHPGQIIYCVDWNMVNALELLHGGRLDVNLDNHPFVPDSPSAADVREIQARVSKPSALFVAHVTPEISLREHLVRAAASLGYEPVTLNTIADSNGRPIFTIFRFRPVARP